MSRALRDPRIRLILALAVLLLIAAVAWHLIIVGLHVMVMLGACMAALAAGLTLGGRSAPVEPVPAPLIESGSTARVRPSARRGRHPPEEGTVLRH